jgi:hypothetical protein
MIIPQKFMDIQAKFQRALKTADHGEIDKISLADLKLAKAHLAVDRNFPYYLLLENKINEKESESLNHGLTVEGITSNFAKNNGIFLAHQFSEESLVVRLKGVIEKNGYNWEEGRRQDLGSISEDILSKIKNCGFFIVLMTKKDQLNSGSFTVSSWLLEEKGAAIAFGHRPLIMVEEDVDRHYVGFLQSDEEIIYFNRLNFDGKIEEAIRKIDNTYKRDKKNTNK